MLMAGQHGGELGGDAGEAAQPPRNTALVQEVWDQLLESSNLFLSPGDFCTVFCEVLFQAGQEVGCFPRNSLALPGRHVCEGTVPSACWDSRQRGRGTAMALARNCIVSALSRDKRNCWADPVRSGSNSLE